jgi:hypothetical protein
MNAKTITITNAIVITFFFLISTSACATSEEIIVNNNLIKLNTKDCSFVYKNKKTKLLLKNECFFVKNSNTEDARIEYYDDIKSYVIVVVGETVNNHPDFPLTQIRKDCGSQLQAIIISKNSSVTTSKLVAGSITCAGLGIDEKEFWILAHQ